ncbi:MAG: Lrp/AsnC ligand binding domain-containing protein [Candidatus Thermoplasmatota archaeon]|jgi:DNA-binding Lrp family transcriptional regulator|nr:Lrp/AsnC ligand binding domain-containing protein [Candidatus Thermoplasmatota archaeon]MDP7264942.1 Lrp/AsnC ligand binding domain-containing protein [Candidatus Thermoplasmatota archaeon]
MAVGFVLISIAPMKERDIHTALSSIPEIVEHHPLFGEFDIIAKIEAEDFNVVGHVVMYKIRIIPGILDTKTLMGTQF